MKITITDDNGKELTTDFIVQELSKDPESFYIISIPFNTSDILISQSFLNNIHDTLSQKGLHNFVLMAIKENNIPIIHKMELKELSNETDN